MYKVEPTFNDVLVRHKGILDAKVRILHNWYALKHCEKSEIVSMVQWAAWRAWEYQKQKIDENGHSPYAYGTYLTNTIKLAIEAYQDMFISNNENEINKLSLQDKSFDLSEYLELSEDIIKLLQKLPERQRTIIQFRYFEELTLKECSKLLDITMERVRQIEEQALENLRSLILNSRE